MERLLAKLHIFIEEIIAKKVIGEVPKRLSPATIITVRIPISAPNIIIQVSHPYGFPPPRE